MFIVFWILYAIVGFISGTLSGLLGISGGVITVPILFFLFNLLDLPQAYLMHIAIGTSLASMTFNSISATWAHNQKGAVVWQTVKNMSLGILLGSIAGALVADKLSGIILEIIFGIFAILLGVYFVLSKKPQIAKKMPSTFKENVLGFVIGGISNILGIGGGIFMVPLLLAFSYPEKKAIGTSVAMGALITFLGAISYLVFGFANINCSGCIGYLYLPAFIIISITTFFAGPYGAKLAHKLPSHKLRKIFAYVLIAIGILMLFA